MSRKRSKLHLDHSEGWAVSYSDLLMVLMSFFIIYFSINDKNSSGNAELNSVILKLAKVSNLEGIDDKYLGNKEKTKVFKMKFKKANLEDPLGGISSDNKIKSIIEKERSKGLDRSIASAFTNKSQMVAPGKKASLEVELDLPDNLYGIGKYEVNNSVKSELKRFLKVIGNDLKSIQIVVTGHTDSLVFNEKNKRVVNNNLILSSMRAAKAVEYLVANGVSKDLILVQGLHDQPRNTRSLSLRVRGR